MTDEITETKIEHQNSLEMGNSKSRLKIYWTEVSYLVEKIKELRASGIDVENMPEF